MQPAAHGQHRILAIMTVVAAVVVTAMLLATLRAAATTSAPSSRTAIVSPAESAHNKQQVLDQGRGIADNADLDSSTGSIVRRDNKNKVIGYVWEAPTEGFSGTWYIIEEGVMMTVVVTPDTRLDNFVVGKMPQRYDWVEAKGRPQEDGTFLARKLRPNRFQPGEVVARLTATATLTDVLTSYSNFSLALLDAQLSDARIYRFAIAEDLDEQAVAAAMAGGYDQFRMGRSELHERDSLGSESPIPIAPGNGAAAIPEVMSTRALLPRSVSR